MDKQAAIASVERSLDVYFQNYNCTGVARLKNFDATSDAEKAAAAESAAAALRGVVALARDTGCSPAAVAAVEERAGALARELDSLAAVIRSAGPPPSESEPEPESEPESEPDPESDPRGERTSEATSEGGAKAGKSAAPKGGKRTPPKAGKRTPKGGAGRKGRR